MPTIQLYASVSTTGILQIPNRKRLQNDLKQFSGHSVELTIKKKNRRSTQQNRYLWGIVYKEIEIRLNELGNDMSSDDVHDEMKRMFNKKELSGEGGELLGYRGGSTTELNKEEFMIYVDKIIEWAASFLSIAIPAPNTDLQLQF